MRWYLVGCNVQEAYEAEDECSIYKVVKRAIGCHVERTRRSATSSLRVRRSNRLSSGRSKEGVSGVEDALVQVVEVGKESRAEDDTPVGAAGKVRQREWVESVSL